MRKRPWRGDRLGKTPQQHIPNQAIERSRCVYNIARILIQNSKMCND